jgi:hypothetical protein
MSATATKTKTKTKTKTAVLSHHALGDVIAAGTTASSSRRRPS